MRIKENLHAYRFNEQFIVHNVLRSTWILVDQEELNKIKKQDYKHLPMATQKKMDLFQILLEDPIEVEKTEHGIPETAYLVMTHQCNLKCVYCYAEASPEKEYEDSLNFVEWIDVLNQLKDCGVKKIIFTGGEVGLSKDALKYIDYAKKIGLTIGLITNGSLVRNAKDAAFLAERCASITISLDSIDQVANDKNRGKGCYRIAMRGIQNLLDSNYPNIAVNTIITNNNFNNIDETVEFLKKNNINYKLGGFSELGRAKMAEISLTDSERTEIELKQKNKNRSPFLKPFTIKESCGLGVGEFAINPVGDIFACKLLETADYKLGNIREKQLSEVFGEENIAFIRSQSINHLTKCNDCSFRYLCGGGCRAHHYYATNDTQGVDEAECNLIKEILKHQMVRSCTNE